jgi:hypothetical protein
MKNFDQAPFTTIAHDDLEGVTGCGNSCWGYCPEAKQEDKSTTTHVEKNDGVQVNPQLDISVLPKGEKT